jgi:hypothetical protein
MSRRPIAGRLATVGLLAAVGVLLAVESTSVRGSTRSGVSIAGAALLFNEATSEGGGEGGTWRVEAPRVDLDGAHFSTRLDLQLPSAGARLEPGPIVLFWGLLLSSVDAAGERDVLSWLATPIEEGVVQPTCDATGSCAASFDIASDLNGVFAAAGAGDLTVAVAFTAVRTFDNGALVQVLPPHVPVDDDGGSFDSPDSTYGIFFLHDAFDLARATPAEVPGTEPGRAADGPLDYASEVRRILAEPATAALTPDPALVVRPWTAPPDQPGLLIGFDIEFLAPCPADRVLAVLDPAGRTLHVADLRGLTRYVERVRVPDERFWQYGLARLDGERLNWQTFDPESIGSGDGVRAVGMLDCADGTGSLDIGGSLPVEPVPDPGAIPGAVASTASPAPSADAPGLAGESGRAGALAVALAVALAAAAGVAALRRARR